MCEHSLVASKVVESRTQDGERIRVRECALCNRDFITREVIDPEAAKLLAKFRTAKARDRALSHGR